MFDLPGAPLVIAIRRVPPASRTKAAFCALALSLASVGIAGHPEPARAATAVTVRLVQDINRNGSSNPHGNSFPGPGVVAVGHTLFFTANDGTHGPELWKSNGTEDGTAMVKDITPDNHDPHYDQDDLEWPTEVDGTLFFNAVDGIHGRELWKSDGTEAGTVMVKDINPGGWAEPNLLTEVDGTLFFGADDGIHGRELWKSDGTEAGTVMVKDIKPDGSSRPLWPTDVGGMLFFFAEDSQLWKSDGTEAGTVMVKDINPGPASAFAGGLTNVGGTLFFGADDGTNGRELWKSDGTGAGTVMVKDINPSSSGIGPFSLTALDATLFLTADDGTYGRELWKSDGTEAGTVMVEDVNPGGHGFAYAGAGWLTDVDDTLFFAADDGTHGPELWQSDGTDGTTMVEDANSDGSPNDPSYLTEVDDTLFFAATDCVHGRELWATVAGEAPPPGEQISHDRRVGLRLTGAKKRRAEGRVRTTDGFRTHCHQRVPVRLQIRPLNGGTWRTHRRLTTNDRGEFKGLIPKRRQRVRAVVPRIVLENGHIFLTRATSPVRRRR